VTARGAGMNNSITNTSPGLFASDNEVGFSVSIAPGSAATEVRQTSHVEPNVLSGQASALAEGSQPGSVVSLGARSFFDVQFELTSAQDYTLSGALEFGGFSIADGRSSVELSGASSIFFTIDNGPFSSSGTLAPGSYRLSIVSEVNTTIFPGGSAVVGARSEWMFIVPEPNSASLLATAAVVFVADRSRRKRQTRSLR
jgi:hypothetical protein